jgi:pyruvate/oxaloacetate carboxyltransferase
MNALQRLDEVLAEVPKVREDLGYPPLVTPMSQIVGTQAVMNVVSGQRYKVVSKEAKDYVKGLYGRQPAPIREEIRSQIMGDEKPIACRPADLLKPELEKMAKEAGDLASSEEDVLTYALFPQAAPKFLKLKKEGRKRTDEEEAAVAAALAAFLTRERPGIPFKRDEFAQVA